MASGFNKKRSTTIEPSLPQILTVTVVSCRYAIRYPPHHLTLPALLLSGTRTYTDTYARGRLKRMGRTAGVVHDIW
ncbi:hypothetical protein BDZ89DRAFT_1076955 [Hymenopellis radicata]|nr:hypothetical protein BDZ89DRAFT_1076955 [Hymenopellis radicata]